MKSPEQVKIDIQKVLDHHEQYKTLKELTDALREANNNMTSISLADAIGINARSLPVLLKKAPYGVAEKISQKNPFGFSSQNGDDQVFKQILFSKTSDRGYWSDRLVEVSRKAIIEEVNDKVASYRQGQLSETDLPTFQTALRLLYPLKKYTSETIVETVIKNDEERIAAGRERLLSDEDRKKLTSIRVGGFFSNKIPTTVEYAALLDAAGVMEKDAAAFTMLPAGTQKKETAFTEAFLDLLECYNVRNNKGAPNILSFSRFTKTIDPNEEGVHNVTLDNLSKGVIAPTQHSVRLLAQAFTVLQTGKAPRQARELPEKVTMLIEAAGFTPQELFRNSHEIIADAGIDMPVFELFRQLRLASDINQPRPEYIKDANIPPTTYKSWELGVAFPDNDRVLQVAEQLMVKAQSFLPPLRNGHPDQFSDEEKAKIRLIAQRSLDKEYASRSESNERKGAKVSEAFRRRRVNRAAEIGSR